jgi:hypothetical protein
MRKMPPLALVLSGLLLQLTAGSAQAVQRVVVAEEFTSIY